MSDEVETAKEQGAVTRWLREIDLASSHEEKWRERAEKIVKRYRDEERRDDTDPSSRFNVLYANTELLKGVLYQKTPVPDVRRRFLDKDPVGRQAAQILQRALSYAVDAYDFDEVMGAVACDVLLPGRGLARVRYVPAESGAYHEVRCESVEWDMVRISPAKRWSRVRWVAFGELFARDDLVNAFGEKGRKCALDWKPKDKEEDKDQFFARALVWQVWHKKTRKVLSVCRGYPDAPLQVVDDPLNLEGFFPIPQPAYSIKTTTSLVPVPEYTQYQDQAIELDRITERIDALVEQLRFRGVSDASHPELEKLADAGDGQFIPIENFAALMEKGGIEKVLMTAPLDVLAKVLLGLYEQRDRVLQIIYQITGISDIVRGSTKATETATAQELKGRYANVRIGPRQKAIANHARDLFRLKAEIIAEKFDVMTLKAMTGPEMWVVDQVAQDTRTGQPIRKKVDATGQIMQLLRNEKLRGFRVDIETDSTVLPDAAEEKQNRIELLTGISSFVANIWPAVQSGAVPMELAKELLSFGVRGFKLGPQLEEALERLGAQGDTQGDHPDIARLTAENQQLRAMADENQLKRDEIAARKEELQAKRGEREAAAAEAQARAQEEAQRRQEDAQVRAEERDMRRLELGARRYEVDAKAREAGANREAEIVKAADAVRAQIGPTDEGLKALAGAIARSSEAQLQAVDRLAAALVRAVSSDKELYVDQKTGRKRVRVVAEGDGRAS